MSAEAVSKSTPVGYKQTEVGVIPEDWEIATLGEVVTKFVHGGTPSTKHEDYWKGDIPWITGADILGQRVSEIRRFITTDAVKNSSTNIVNKGNLLLVSRTGVGKLAIALCDIAISQDFTGICTKSEKLSTKYLFRFLDMNQSILKNQNQGTSILGITRETLSSLIILFPPTIVEQEAIATALSDTDALVESLEQLIAKKRQIKQGAMQELLRPKDWWIVKNLGEIANIKTGSRNNQDKIEDGEYPFFVRSATMERINSYSYDCEAILVPGEGGIGSIFHYICGRFDVHQRVYAITQFIKEVSGKYVFFYMKKNFGEHAMQNTVKATVDSLRLPTFQNFEITMPPSVEEQAAIATIISDMDAEITALEQKLTKTRDLKQGMMQELLTGRIRLV